jgi:hypothetical protein
MGGKRSENFVERTNNLDLSQKGFLEEVAFLLTLKNFLGDIIST